ncbi:hypothetical protein PMIN06_012742 [Paraphaeosphaeria minitans]
MHGQANPDGPMASVSKLCCSAFIRALACRLLRCKRPNHDYEKPIADTHFYPADAGFLLVPSRRRDAQTWVGNAVGGLRAGPALRIPNHLTRQVVYRHMLPFLGADG